MNIGLSDLRCYDNGGKTLDRYTVIAPRWAKDWFNEAVYGRTLWNALGASEFPFDPQGFGQHTSAMPGKHLGKRVAFADMPEQVQRFAKQCYIAVE